MKTTSHRRRALGASLVAAALALSGSALTALPANALAPGLNPDNRLGDITLDVTSGDISLTGGPQRLTTEVGCPEGYRNSSRVLFVWSDGTWPTGPTTSSPALVIVAPTDFAGSGLAGEPIVRTNASPISSTGRYASRWNAGGFPGSNFAGHSGTASYLITCDPGAAPSDTFPPAAGGVGDSKYFSVDLDLDIVAEPTSALTGTWSVASGEPADKTPTITELASSSVTATSATLTATVAPAEATGTITFKDGTTTVGSAEVASGTATLPVEGLVANTAYTFTAEYSGDATHEASSDQVSFSTLPAAPSADDAETGIGVTVPAPGSDEPTGLTISVSPAAASLTGGVRAEGSPWTASGALGDVTVNDDRRVTAGSAWTLNGRVSDFTSGANTIAASSLGWTPQKVSGAGTAGAAATDLSADRPLATGAASEDPNVQTTVDANLTLIVPTSAPAGDYSATLTLTLI